MMRKKNKRVQEEITARTSARSTQQMGRANAALAMQRKIHRLQRSLTERENDIWTLKQLLLYR